MNAAQVAAEWARVFTLGKARGKIAELFEGDRSRAQRMSRRACGMLYDFSKTALTEESFAALIDLAEAADVTAARDAMFAGEKINTTEGRAVLHTALRAGPDAVIEVDGVDVMPEVRATLARMADFAREVRAGEFTDVVNIGIGGSDLGPAMASLALAPYSDGPRLHFVSNIDGAHIHDVLKGLNAATTLVLVASKTFTTIETMTNAETARRWMAKSVAEPAAHFVAISSAEDKAAAFGIPAGRVFGFEDWVGGRYSVWGPIGLSLMLAIGPEDFAMFLAGAAEMDAHFAQAPLTDNLPVIHALVGLWHHQVCGYKTRAVLPYDQRLSRLPAYLQQLEMESNGKRVSKTGEALSFGSGPIVWGEPGTNGQHAFYQLLHQGTQIVPAEFLVAMQGHEAELAHHHALLVANCFAQSQALMLGRDHDQPQRVFEGNRPSVTMAYEKLTPLMLGRIIALYEHRVFVEGAILGINSFDQFGVELGKALAMALQPLLEGAEAEIDSSTAQLVAFYRESLT
ncbi:MULTISPECIES: glucose-6-phosphate isomerase [Lentibacter]|jgi:glucose-6-phosphate isomerase|uniref:Glucose-6-phosphate isomerase n=1 Tax=Lentibacter algarum TaxID=576131 RepID=A0A1H3KP97_9RHOB|nr:glucose-6-phosphate isomerase [Lentibacter algarum]WIF31826.1 glucose-6-phosphate isomerase Pgi [Lentibacter algarum]SDY53876.1 glucose-6-phosphate isomerase [Lentibacter algarum]